MRDQLERLHMDLLRDMARMRELIAPSQPDMAEVSMTRLRLSRGSAARSRFIATTIYPALLAQVGRDAAINLRRLQDEMADDRVRSSTHVARWTSGAVEGDWPGYQRAAQTILSMMTRRIEREKSLLYPLLRGIAAEAPAPRAATGT